MPPVINQTICTKCGYCVQICPLDVLFIQKTEEIKQVIVRYPEECWHCKACQKDCPSGAITMRYPLSHFMLHYPKEKHK